LMYEIAGLLRRARNVPRSAGRQRGRRGRRRGARGRDPAIAARGAVVSLADPASAVVDRAAQLPREAAGIVAALGAAEVLSVRQRCAVTLFVDVAHLRQTIAAADLQREVRGVAIGRPTRALATSTRATRAPAAWARMAAVSPLVYHSWDRSREGHQHDHDNAHERRVKDRHCSVVNRCAVRRADVLAGRGRGPHGHAARGAGHGRERWPACCARCVSSPSRRRWGIGCCRAGPQRRGRPGAERVHRRTGFQQPRSVRNPRPEAELVPADSVGRISEVCRAPRHFVAGCGEITRPELPATPRAPGSHAAEPRCGSARRAATAAVARGWHAMLHNPPAPRFPEDETAHDHPHAPLARGFGH